MGWFEKIKCFKNLTSSLTKNVVLFIESGYLFLGNLSKPSFDVSSNINSTKYLLFSAEFPCKLCNDSKLYISSDIKT